jgi:adenylylsulfate kinase-like enzyme
MMDTLLIALVGLPARGKSTMGRKIARTIELDDLEVRVFNNGELRRTLSDENTSSFLTKTLLRQIFFHRRTRLA